MVQYVVPVFALGVADEVEQLDIVVKSPVGFSLGSALLIVLHPFGDVSFDETSCLPSVQFIEAVDTD